MVKHAKTLQDLTSAGLTQNSRENEARHSPKETGALITSGPPQPKVISWEMGDQGPGLALLLANSTALI